MHKSITSLYPHRSREFVRDSAWYTDTWREMSNWCTEQFGQGKWEFYDRHFVFTSRQSLTLFILRWK